MAVKKKYIVVRAEAVSNTVWTDPKRLVAKPVSKSSAAIALKKAQKKYPNEWYKIQEVKQDGLFQTSKTT